MDASSLINDIRLMPVVVIDDAELALPLGKALLDAGIQAIEITLRTEAALEAMARLTRDLPELLLGAGSVRQPEQFTQIADAGARFAVSPGASETLLAAANMPYIPGAATASECLRLLEHGYTLQKFFPAEINGGVAAIKALSAPLPEVRFCPTGGINAKLAPNYFALGCVACVGGSWFVPNDLLANRDFAGITALARAAVELSRA